MENNFTAPLFLEPDITLTKGGNGMDYLQSNHALGESPTSLLAYLNRWVKERPDTVFLAERNATDPNLWDTISYLELSNQATLLAAGLDNTALSPERPLLILSGNSIACAVVTFACYIRGVPVVPISPAYSLMSKEFEQIKYIHETINPGLAFAESHETFKPALDFIGTLGTQFVTADINEIEESWSTLNGLCSNTKIPYQDLPPVNVCPDTIAKILFTSGSTGKPKGVINTHGMLTSNQEAIAMIWPFIESPGHVILDWLPWNHTFGGNHNFNMVLRNGASLYIDGGKPTPAGLEITLRNLVDVSPTLYFNVAVGYEMLATVLEKKPELARKFFKNLRLLFFAAAALPKSTWDRLEALVDKYATHDIPITSSWGATETAPLCTSVYFSNKLSNNIGVPIPGLNIKLAPVGDLTELRVKGPNIMPGYFNNENKTKEVFDEEGYFCSGDAVELVDRFKPELGLLFKGRVSENFKLLTATWVNVGEVRLAIIASLAPYISDVVICGHNENFLSALLFPNVQECQLLNAETALSDNENLVEKLIKLFAEYNANNSGSSRRIRKFTILDSPPSFDKNEITDKGYINQRGVLSNRADSVTKFYSGEESNEVVAIG